MLATRALGGGGDKLCLLPTAGIAMAKVLTSCGTVVAVGAIAQAVFHHRGTAVSIATDHLTGQLFANPWILLVAVGDIATTVIVDIAQAMACRGLLTIPALGDAVGAVAIAIVAVGTGLLLTLIALDGLCVQ